MRKAWAVLWTVYFASVVVVINQFKVPPVMGILMDQLHLSPVMAGWTMSIFSVTGIILALPAAFILGRLGSKASGLVGLGCSVLGCVIGAISPGSEVLLLGRVVEGLGMGLIGVIAPATIAMHFKHGELGLPMGIWATWVGMGCIIAFSVALPIESAFGWRGIWWFGAMISLVAFVLFAVVVTNPKSQHDGDAAAKAEKTRIPYLEGFRTPGIWMLSLMFFAMVFCFASLATWVPQYFVQVLGASPAAANSFVTTRFIASIFGSVIGGLLLTKFRNHKTMMIVFMIGAGLVYAFTFSMSKAMILPLMIFGGMFSELVAVAVFTMAPAVMPTAILGGLAMGLVSLFQFISQLVGPPIVGSAVASGNWFSADYPMWAVMAVGVVISIVFAIFVKPRQQLDL